MEKGHTNNPNGRPKGTPNKVTATIRSWLFELVNANRDQLESDLKQLDPAARVDVLLKILPYVLPKATTPDEVEGAAFTKDDVKQGGGWFDGPTMKQWYEK